MLTNNSKRTPAQRKLFTALLIIASLLFAENITAEIVIAETAAAPAEDKKYTSGFLQELHEQTPLHKGEARTGQQVYEYRCVACHGKNTQGAPIPGDKREWSKRSKQGMDVLLEHTVNGYGDFMPAKGGCRDCRLEELKAAISYMLEQKELLLDLQ